MNTDALRNALLSDIHDDANSHYFHTAKTRHLDLAGYADFDAILAQLADREIDYAVKDTLTRIMLIEYQSTKAGVWASALLLAYLPMLCYRRRYLFGTFSDAKDIDQVIIESFLDAARDLPITPDHDRTTMRLRELTISAARRIMRHEQKEKLRLRQLCSMAEQEDSFDLFAQRTPRNETLAEDELCTVKEILSDYLYEDITPAQSDMLIATIVQGEQLQDFVERRYFAQNKEDRTRTYHRLQKQRQRLVALLAERLREEYENRMSF